MKLDEKQVAKHLLNLGFEQESSALSLSFKGSLKAGRIDVPVELIIPDLNFVELPKVRVDSEFLSSHNLRGHLSEGNVLCYTDDNMLVLDLFQTISSIRAVLELSEKTLREIIHSNPEAAIQAEIMSYWKGDCYYIIEDLADTIVGTVGQLEVTDNRVLTVIACSEKTIERWAKKLNSNFKIFGEVMVVTIDGNIPSPVKLPNLKLAFEWLAKITGEEVSSFYANSRNMNSPCVVIVGNNGIIGFNGKENSIIKQASKGKGFRKSKANELWRSLAENIEIEKFYGRLCSSTEILSRNANEFPVLANKKICLIGCGTIGGYLARMLVQAGAGTGSIFSLIDNQVFMPENVGRHVLGFSSVGRYKSEALVSMLEKDFPEVKIEAIVDAAQSVIGQFRNYDLIIDATGTERFSAMLNFFAQEEQKKATFPPVIYSMIFGNGIATQSFLANGSKDDACYKCLRPEYGRPWRFYPIKNTTTDMDIAVRPCSDGSFIPFGVEASVSAAMLTFEQVKDFFSGNLNGTLRTMVIDKEKGIEIPRKTIQQASNCPVCLSQ